LLASVLSSPDQARHVHFVYFAAIIFTAPNRDTLTSTADNLRYRYDLE
jgi:hypothetical protein